MSGPICPDCGSFEIHQVDNTTDRCSFCGWHGPTRPRRALTMETQHRLAEENRRNMELKEAGALYFLRVYFEDAQFDFEATRSEIYDILGKGDELQSGRAQPYLFIKLSSKPDSEALGQIQGLNFVKKIDVV